MWLMQQLGHTGLGSRGRNGGDHISQTLGVLMGTAWNIYWATNPDEDRSLFWSAIFSPITCAIISSSGCNYHRSCLWTSKVLVASMQAIDWPFSLAILQRKAAKMCNPRLF